MARLADRPPVTRRRRVASRRAPLRPRRGRRRRLLARPRHAAAQPGVVDPRLAASAALSLLDGLVPPGAACGGLLESARAPDRCAPRVVRAADEGRNSSAPPALHRGTRRLDLGPQPQPGDRRDREVHGLRVHDEPLPDRLPACRRHVARRREHQLLLLRAVRLLAARNAQPHPSGDRLQPRPGVDVRVPGHALRCGGMAVERSAHPASPRAEPDRNERRGGTPRRLLRGGRRKLARVLLRTGSARCAAHRGHGEGHGCQHRGLVLPRLHPVHRIQPGCPGQDDPRVPVLLVPRRRSACAPGEHDVRAAVPRAPRPRGTRHETGCRRERRALSDRVRRAHDRTPAPADGGGLVPAARAAADASDGRAAARRLPDGQLLGRGRVLHAARGRGVRDDGERPNRPRQRRCVRQPAGRRADTAVRLRRPPSRDGVG